jgi:hypothetical protein
MAQVIKKGSFASIDLKVANMRQEQNFTIYPYKGGDEIQIQSRKRIARINLKTGKGVINTKNEQGGAYGYHIQMQAVLTFQLDQESITSLQEFLWNNPGTQGTTCLKWNNEELFSKN